MKMAPLNNRTDPLYVADDRQEESIRAAWITKRRECAPTSVPRPHRWWNRAILLIVIAIMTVSGLAPAEEVLTEALLAERYNLTVEQIRRLHKERAVSLQDIPLMPAKKLSRALWRLDNPKPDHPGEAVEFRVLQQRSEDGKVPHNALMNAWQQKQAMPYDPKPWENLRRIIPEEATEKHGVAPRTAGIEPTAWSWIGPGNVGGRVRSVLIHPTDTDTLWAGSVSGGIWKSINGGTTWFALDDFMATLAVSTMAMNPTNANTLYAGTGEGFYNADSIRGAGIFKSLDGGTSWQQLPSTTSSSYYYVNRLAVHPTDGQILLAATGSGIYRTTNGGASWSLSRSGRALDIDFAPDDGSNCIASGPSGLTLYSSDGGVSWASATGVPAAGRVEVAYAPSNPSTVFASVENNSGEVYRSTDGGQTYSLRNTGNNYLGSQGWYDNVVWVNPVDEDMVIVGGIDLWRSVDGGASLTKISQWYSAPSLDSTRPSHMPNPDRGFSSMRRPSTSTAYFLPRRATCTAIGAGSARGY